MKHFLISLVIFAVVFIVYFVVGTNYTLKPKWALDYFNLLAQSIINFRLDLNNLGTTYDLSYYNNKWYGPWGVIPALILIPIQLIKGNFIPTFYLSVLFSSLNTVLMYLLLLRLRREFLPGLSILGIYVCLSFFAFGTTQFYVGTLGSIWHVDQITTSFLGTLGVYIIFRKRRKLIHYFVSMVCLSLAVLGRPTIALLAILPITLYIFDLQKRKALTSLQKLKKIFIKEIILLCIPLIFFSIIFFLYNYVRFGNIFEYGFNYIHESSYLAQLREESGPFSIRNIFRNLWYMVFELPTINFKHNNIFNFNLNGNSIFFLSPPLLAIFFTSPLRKISGKFIFDSYIFPLWITIIITLFPSWMHYSSGWMQFGYRYSLDIMVLLFLLFLFGIKGKLNMLYIFGIIFSIIMYILGIRSLM